MHEADKYERTLKRRRHIAKRMNKRLISASLFSATTLASGGLLAYHEIESGLKFDTVAEIGAAAVLLGSAGVVNESRRYGVLKGLLTKTDDEISAMRTALTAGGRRLYIVNPSSNGGFQIKETDSGPDEAA